MGICKKNKSGGKHEAGPKHRGKRKEIGKLKPGKREKQEGVSEPKPEHDSTKCPRNKRDAQSRRGKQGLTIYTCNGCGNVWSE